MIRISNKIKTLLAMLSFVQVTSGCDATVQDIIIDTDPGVEIGNNDYYTWCKETLSVIDKDLKISGTHSYYENQDRSQVSFIWGNIFLLYTYTEGISLSKSEWSDALMNCFLNFDNYWHPNYKLTSDYDPKNTFDIEKYLNRKEKINPNDEFVVIDADSLPSA